MKPACLLVLAAACLVAPARADDAKKGEDVSFKTADGLTIAATYWAPATTTAGPPPVVVALPMYKHARGTYAPMVGPITDRGMALLALDLRGHGDSAKQGDEDLSKKVDARDPALFNAMHVDVEAAVAWLAKEKKTPKGKIGLLGASVGCSVAIDSAVRSPDEFAAVVCLTPGKNYLGVPTMEHVAKWPTGKPLLLVSSEWETETGAGPIMNALDGKGAELRIVGPRSNHDGYKNPGDRLHGTNMINLESGESGIVDNLADWLAFHLAFQRTRLADDVVAIVGSTGDAMYVGLETSETIDTTEAFKKRLSLCVVRVGVGPADSPWSKTESVDIGQRFDWFNRPMKRRSTKIGRARLGAESGRPFPVQISLDRKSYFPEAGAPPLLITLK